MDKRLQTHFPEKHQVFQTAKELPLVNPGCDLAERTLRVELSLIIRRPEV